MGQNKVTKEEFNAMLLHFRTGENRWEGIRDVDVSGLNLRGIDIRGIAFQNVNFSSTTLDRALMQDALFRNCSFTAALIRSAHLEDTKLVECDIRGAVFINSNAQSARFVRCNLSCTYFNGADLTNASFGASELKEAHFDNAQMLHADLDDALCTETIVHGTPLVCPEKGGFTAFKQCVEAKSYKEFVVELYIPARAKRSSATSRKCRASEAKVMGIYSKTGKRLSARELSGLHIVSHHNNLFEYKLGATVRPTRAFDENRWHECASGIHFFLTFEEAANY